jgi:hypothetical protein
LLLLVSERWAIARVLELGDKGHVDKMNQLWEAGHRIPKEDWAMRCDHHIDQSVLESCVAHNGESPAHYSTPQSAVVLKSSLGKRVKRLVDQNSIRAVPLEEVFLSERIVCHNENWHRLWQWFDELFVLRVTCGEILAVDAMSIFIQISPTNMNGCHVTDLMGGHVARDDLKDIVDRAESRIHQQSWLVPNVWWVIFAMKWKPIQDLKIIHKGGRIDFVRHRREIFEIVTRDEGDILDWLIELQKVARTSIIQIPNHKYMRELCRCCLPLLVVLLFHDEQISSQEAQSIGQPIPALDDDVTRTSLAIRLPSWAVRKN